MLVLVVRPCSVRQRFPHCHSLSYRHTTFFRLNLRESFSPGLDNASLATSHLPLDTDSAFSAEKMASVDAVGDPVPTSAVLMASSKHIGSRCRSENMAFISCKKRDANPDRCLQQGREVTHCVLNLLKGLHQRCSREMDAYVGCMHYQTNEFDLCRKEQQAFESACPWNE